MVSHLGGDEAPSTGPSYDKLEMLRFFQASHSAEMLLAFKLRYVQDETAGRFLPSFIQSISESSIHPRR